MVRRARHQDLDGDVDLTDYNVGLALTSITIEGVPRLEDATIYHCSHPSFARAAIEALQHWRFSPLKVDGELREVMVFTDFVFALRW